MKVYLTYRFKDKDPVIDRLKTIINDEGVSFADVSLKSGVAPSTLWNWFDGPTKRPQFATVMAVARSLGYDLKVVKGEKVATKAPLKKPTESRLDA